MDPHQSRLSPESNSLSEKVLPTSDLAEIGFKLQRRIAHHNITLLPLSQKVTVADLRTHFPTGQIFACDFYVQDIEKMGNVTPYGITLPGEHIENIDHHAPIPEMCRPLSSGNLAQIRVAQKGIAAKVDHIAINHTDCDSVISAATIRGLIPIDPVFANAVLDADHYGTENPISDLLQALDPERNLELSLTELSKLLQGQDLSPEAEKIYQRRLRGRLETKEALKSGVAVKQLGPLTVVEITKAMRNEFMPALLPEAMVILTFEKGATPDTRVMRLRLGKNAPAGLTLSTINMDAVDPLYGGRWNAGSNKRGGGTKLSVDEYRDRVQGEMDRVLERL